VDRKCRGGCHLCEGGLVDEDEEGEVDGKLADEGCEDVRAENFGVRPFGRQRVHRFGGAQHEEQDGREEAAAGGLEVAELDALAGAGKVGQQKGATTSGWC
jgi:hypothetical protein